MDLPPSNASLRTEPARGQQRHAPLRLAVLADVHGNLAALEACLEEVDALAVDEVIVAGDLVNGAPDSKACWDLARERGFTLLRGNHERYLYDFHTPQADPLWHTERFAPVRWAVAQFTPGELEEMRALPLCYRHASAPELLIVHATARRDNESVLAYTPSSAIDEAFAGCEAARLIVRAHNHLPTARPWRDATIVTSGSVGLPLDGRPTAKFVLLERDVAGNWRFEHRAVPYDVERTVRRFRESGYLEVGGAMARLMLREVATGSHQMMPFFSYWEEHIPEVDDLDEAVARFLAAY